MSFLLDTLALELVLFSIRSDLAWNFSKFSLTTNFEISRNSAYYLLFQEKKLTLKFFGIQPSRKMQFKSQTANIHMLCFILPILTPIWPNKTEKILKLIKGLDHFDRLDFKLYFEILCFVNTDCRIDVFETFIAIGLGDTHPILSLIVCKKKKLREALAP